MEERIIDDEYGRGIRLKKTKNGYVDVTDDLAEERVDEENEPETGEEEYEEVAFEFPDLEEDDEDLVGLSPEEAMALRKKKEEEEKARALEYAKQCEEGNMLLESGSFHGAELKFEKALALDGEAVDATVGYWRAKTSNFAEPDILVSEYAESGYENLEGDLGYKAVEILKNKYADTFSRRLNELDKELVPIEESFKEKQESRRQIIRERMTKAGWKFSLALVPTLILLTLAIVFGTKMFSTRTGEFIVLTAVFAGLFVVGLIVTLVFTNKLLNVMRIHRANEKESSTEEGRKILSLRDYIEIYTRLTEHVIDFAGEETEE
jgi:hypothetical protein